MEVQEGEIFAFLGPNGAGKTTTVEILEGYGELRLSHGSEPTGGIYGTALIHDVAVGDAQTEND